MFCSGDFDGVIEMLFRLFRCNVLCVLLLFCVLKIIVEGFDIVFLILVIILGVMIKFCDG